MRPAAAGAAAGAPDFQSALVVRPQIE